jgi:hypothetical protein
MGRSRWRIGTLAQGSCQGRVPKFNMVNPSYKIAPEMARQAVKSIEPFWNIWAKLSA